MPGARRRLSGMLCECRVEDCSPVRTEVEH